MFDKYLCKKYHSKEIFVETLYMTFRASKYFWPFLLVLILWDILWMYIFLYAPYGIVTLGVFLLSVSIVGVLCVLWLLPLKIATCPQNENRGVSSD